MYGGTGERQGSRCLQLLPSGATNGTVRGRGRAVGVAEERLIGVLE
jgi:hypothetical protein